MYKVQYMYNIAKCRQLVNDNETIIEHCYCLINSDVI